MATMPIRITPSQMTSLAASADPTIERLLGEHLEAFFPEVVQLSGIDPSLLYEARRRADEYGFANLAGYKHFLNFMLMFGPEFDRAYPSEQAVRVREVLRSKDLGPEERIEAVYAIYENDPL